MPEEYVSPSGWGSLVGGAITFWLGISLYIATVDLHLTGAFGSVFFAGGIFFAGVGVILMVAGTARILARMGFNAPRAARPTAVEPAPEQSPSS